MEPIRIYYNKRKAILWSLLILSIMGLFATFLIAGIAEVPPVVSILMLAMMSILLIPGIKNSLIPALKGIPLYILDEKGFTYTPRQMFIKWEDIESMQEVLVRPRHRFPRSVGSFKTLAIKLKDFENRERYPYGNWFRRLVRTNKAFIGDHGHLMVTPGSLEGREEGIFRIFRDALSRHQAEVGL